MGRHLIPFKYVDQGDDDSIDLAFSKKRVDDRKDWLRNLKPGTFLDHDTDAIRYQEFINKELILFSMADNVRSIPSVVDGFKPGQRKVCSLPLAFFHNFQSGSLCVLQARSEDRAEGCAACWLCG
jgi:DNA topoisomerase-2